MEGFLLNRAQIVNLSQLAFAMPPDATFTLWRAEHSVGPQDERPMFVDIQSESVGLVGSARKRYKLPSAGGREKVGA